MGVFGGPNVSEDGLVLALDAANPRNFNLTEVEVLVVGGGGGGSVGTNGGGGGGAGGFRTETAFPITPGVAISVTVGDGGSGSVGRGLGTNGGNSVFSTITSTGGGRGGGSGNAQGANGGSGGGGQYSGAGGSSSPVTSPSQGFAGGSGALFLNRPYEVDQGGGGGGASQSGADGPGSSGPGGNGGNGSTSSISGTLVTYAGGGGGATNDTTTTSLGGSGGGGFGASTSTKTGGNGGVNLGGGGGAGNGGGGNSGAGGSGIVIVRYPGSQRATGGTVTFVAGHTIHTFTTSGTFTPNGAPGTGTIWTDFSNNGNSGTLVNGVGYSASNGGSLSFDGSNDIITIPSTGIVTNNISVDIWFNVNSAKTYAALLGSNATEKYEMLIKTASNLEISLSPGNYIQHNNILSINTWTNIVVSASNGVAWKVYKNGVDLGTPPVIAGTYQISGTGVSNIDQGRIRNDVGSFAFSGNIASTKIYNRALTAAEISQNFNALRGRFGI